MTGPRSASPRAARSTIRRSVGLAALALALVAALPAPPALAAACDEIINGATTLTADVGSSGTPCALNGLRLRGSGYTLDLNGHTIWGTANIGYSGIDINGAKRVKVINGTIRGFSAGVTVAGGSSITLDDIVVLSETAGGVGVLVYSSAGVVVNNVIAVDSSANGGFGFGIGGNTGKVTLSNSTASGFAMGALLAGNPAGSAIAVNASTFTSSGLQVNLNDDSCGVGVRAALGVCGNVGTPTLTGNVILGSSGTGIYVDCSDGTTDVGAVALTGNRVVSSDLNGFDLRNCTVGSSTVSNNLAAKNGGASYSGFGADHMTSLTFTGNRAAENGQDGIALSNLVGATVSGNRSDLNGGAGFAVDTAGATFTGNLSRGNGGVGFATTAADATLDASNRAFGNAVGQDCDGNVTCDLHPATPSATQPSCYGTVTTSIVLGGDLICGNGATSAIYIPAGTSRVTIDLNGYTLAGFSSAIELQDPSPASKNITIKNGFLKDGDYGVIIKASGSTVKLENVYGTSGRMVYQDNPGGAAGSTVTATDIVHAGAIWALDIYSTSPVGTAIVSNSLTGSGSYGFAANVVKADGVVVLLGATTQGVNTEGGSVIQNSVLIGGYPVFVSCTPRSGAVTVKANLIAASLTSPGLYMEFCTGGTVANNLAVANDYTGFDIEPADGFTISGNRAYANGTDGYYLTFLSSTAVLKSNLADLNLHNGMYLSGAPRSLASTVARSNAWYGIASSVTAGGSGNIAFGNALGDCSSVTCVIGG